MMAVMATTVVMEIVEVVVVKELLGPNFQQKFVFNS